MVTCTLRTLLSFGSLLLALFCAASTYHVTATFSDGKNGLSLVTAWGTVPCGECRLEDDTVLAYDGNLVDVNEPVLCRMRLEGEAEPYLLITSIVHRPAFVDEGRGKQLSVRLQYALEPCPVHDQRNGLPVLRGSRQIDPDPDDAVDPSTFST